MPYHLAILHMVWVRGGSEERAMQGREDIAIITKYLVNISKRRTFWSLNDDILKINDSDYLRASTHQRPQRKEDQYAVSREDQYAVLDPLDTPYRADFQAL
ncbi:hypothetical protein Tco_0356490 [Tanacetum coccineum]